MVRFYKSYLGRLLLGLLVLIEVEKEVGKDGVIGYVRKWRTDSESESLVVADAVDFYLGAYPDESPVNEEVLKGALGQLTKKKSDDVDLLDAIVTALRLPFANYFNSGSIKALRDAILTPNELTDLKKAFKDSKHCACGHTFGSSEMVTISHGDSSIIIQCHRCTRPNYVRCDYCSKMVLITSKIGANLRNEVDCGCRKRKQAEEGLLATPGAILTAAAQGHLTGAQLRRMRAAVVRPGNHPVPTPTPTRTIPLTTAPTRGGVNDWVTRAVQAIEDEAEAIAFDIETATLPAAPGDDTL